MVEVVVQQMLKVVLEVLEVELDVMMVVLQREQQVTLLR